MKIYDYEIDDEISQLSKVADEYYNIHTELQGLIEDVEDELSGKVQQALMELLEGFQEHMVIKEEMANDFKDELNKHSSDVLSHIEINNPNNAMHISDDVDELTTQIKQLDQDWQYGGNQYIYLDQPNKSYVSLYADNREELIDYINQVEYKMDQQQEQLNSYRGKIEELIDGALVKSRLFEDVIEADYDYANGYQEISVEDYDLDINQSSLSSSSVMQMAIAKSAAYAPLILADGPAPVGDVIYAVILGVILLETTGEYLGVIETSKVMSEYELENLFTAQPAVESKDLNVYSYPATVNNYNSIPPEMQCEVVNMTYDLYGYFTTGVEIESDIMAGDIDELNQDQLIYLESEVVDAMLEYYDIGTADECYEIVVNSVSNSLNEGKDLINE